MERQDLAPSGPNASVQQLMVMTLAKIVLLAICAMACAAAQAAGTYTYSFSFVSDREARSPVGLTTDAQRNIYVADSNNNEVDVFRQDGTYLRSIRDASYYGLNTPVSVAIGAEDRVHVYAFNGNNIQTYDRDGTLLNAFTRDGSTFFNLRANSQLATDGQGHVYVPVFGKSSVEVYDQDGHFLRDFGAGQLLTPIGLTLDRQGNVLVYDTLGNGGAKILTFSQNGQLLSSFSTWYGGMDLAVDVEGNILVTNTWGVDRYSSAGIYIDGISMDGAMLKGGIAVDADNRLLVSVHSVNGGQVRVFTSSVPEPHTWALFLVGLGGLAWVGASGRRL
jgi:DNA-binding beta-propeller fold protein YncE